MLGSLLNDRHSAALYDGNLRVLYISSSSLLVGWAEAFDTPPKLETNPEENHHELLSLFPHVDIPSKLLVEPLNDLLLHNTNKPLAADSNFVNFPDLVF